MTPAAVKPPISFAELDRVDIRVGTILAVEDVANSEKLLRLRVDFGDHTRSILAGMKKERQNPKEIEGKQALFSATPTGWCRCWRCRKNRFLMEPGQVKVRFPLAAASSPTDPAERFWKTPHCRHWV